MPSWFPEEKWSGRYPIKIMLRPSTIASIPWSMRPTNSMELPNYSIFWPVSLVVLLFLWEMSTSFSSRLSSSHFTRSKPANSTMNNSLDVRCSSSPRTPLLQPYWWRDCWDIGPSQTLPRRLCSWMNFLKFWKCVKSPSLNHSSLSSSRDSSNVSPDPISK